MKKLILIALILLIVNCHPKENKSLTLRKLDVKTFSAAIAETENCIVVPAYLTNSVFIVSLDGSFKDKTIKTVRTYPGRIILIDNICWIGGGEYLQDGKLLKLDLINGSSKMLTHNNCKEINALAYNHSKCILATGHGNGEIILWDTVSLKKKSAFGDYDAEIFSISISKDGSKLFSGDDLGQLISWDLTNGKKLNRIKLQHINSIYFIMIEENTNSIFFAGGCSILGIIDQNDLSIRREINFSDFGNHAILSCDYRNDDKTIICGLTRGSIAICRSDGTMKRILKLHDTDIIYVKFIKDGRKIVSVDEYGTIKLWEL